MVYSILYGLLFQQDHSCFYQFQSFKEEVFQFFIFSQTYFIAFLHLQLLINHFLFKLQNEYFENLNKLKEILISFKRKYFNWVNFKFLSLHRYYLKNIYFLRMRNETQNNHFYVLGLKLKFLDFQNHSNTTRVIFNYFNIIHLEVILQLDLIQNKALNQIKLQSIRCYPVRYLIRHLLRIKIEHVLIFIILFLLFFQVDLMILN